MDDKIYNELCSIMKRGSWRKPVSILEFFVDMRLINIFEVQGYLDKYKKENKDG